MTDQQIEIEQLRAALTQIANFDKAPLTHEHAPALLGVIRSMCDCARAALSSEERR